MRDDNCIFCKIRVGEIPSTKLYEDEDFIKSIAEEKYRSLLCEKGLSVKEFANLHPTIAKRVIVKYCADLSAEVDNFHINAIYEICISCGKTSLPQNKSAIVRDDMLTIVDSKAETVNSNFSVEIEKQNNDIFEKDKKIHNLLLKNIINCDKIEGELILRTRQSGDCVRLKNKNCTKTLKKLFCEYKIPLDERENLPILCDDLGVVWIYKIGVAERCAADQSSKNILKLNVKKI